MLPPVETMAAGPGNLEVTVNGGRVPTAAAAQGAHTYAISFTPRDPRPHTVELRFNGDHVPGKLLISFILLDFDEHVKCGFSYFVFEESLGIASLVIEHVMVPKSLTLNLDPYLFNKQRQFAFLYN